MTSVPYPTFVEASLEQRASLAAVGRCRIHLDAASDSSYRAILDKCKEQAGVDIESGQEAAKKLQKKCMKEGVAMASDYLQKQLRLDISVIDVEVLIADSNDMIHTAGCLASCFLDAGCARIVLPVNDILLDAIEAARIPRDRLMVHIPDFAGDLSQLNQLVQQVEDDCDSVSVFIENAQQVTLSEILSMAKTYEKVDVVVQFRPSDNTAALAELVGSVLKNTPHDTSNSTISLVDPTAKQLGVSCAASLKTDRVDGLFTTVVCTRSGEALGLVYSSVESIVAALQSGRGVYYSRSRNSLWRKGDTSGHYQTLHRIDVDCDGDAVRFTVTQRSTAAVAGAFCHLETLTCWGAPRGLRHLEETLQERLKSAPEGSYTKRLFQDEALLQEKLVEEAQELAEADTPQHVAEELADVLYFAMVCAAKAGVSIDDAAAELDRRTRKVTRRKGDSKAFRIEAGKAILDKAKENN
jgi:phosphoribosyl-ATP pyrophosphohydrolase / phosphoribosyl-AMP cyclohydrolase / histidinol dehydrogenase